MQELTFVVTLDEANIILGSLGKQPFEAVATLIPKLQQQAQPQLQQQAPEGFPEGMPPQE